MKYVVCAALCLALASPAARAEDAPRHMTSMTFMKGLCRHMTMNGEELKPCKGALASFTYDDGRQSFIFSNGSLTTQDTQMTITFSGNSHDDVVQPDGSISRPIDLLISGSTPQNMTDHTATGTCTFFDPAAGVAKISCTAKTDTASWTGEFITDGAKPDVMKMP